MQRGRENLAFAEAVARRDPAETASLMRDHTGVLRDASTKDPAGARGRFRAAVEELTVRFAEAPPAVVNEVADNLIIMYGGRAVEFGLVAELFDDPQRPFTIGPMGSMCRRTGRFATMPSAVPLSVHMPKGGRFVTRCPFATGAASLNARTPSPPFGIP